jgi:hypothetical protein
MKKFVSEAVHFYRSETETYRVGQRDHSRCVARMATQEQYDKLIDICSQQKETINSLLKRIEEFEAVAIRNQQQQKAPLIKPSSLTAVAPSGDASDSLDDRKEYYTDEEELEQVTSGQTRKRRRRATKKG